MVKHQRFSLLVLSLATVVGFALVFLIKSDEGISSVYVKYLTSTFILTAELVLLTWSLYQALISIAGFFRVKRPRPREASTKTPRILCLTAAHNEEAVIAGHIRSMQALNYPDHSYDIVIIADNCTDATAKIARKLGATVWERCDPEVRGKGHALRWALHSKARLSRYDAVCFFDADNLVHSEFLEEMAQQLAAGHVAIQGYLDTKNPGDSWITMSYASMYWFMNRFWQLSRAVLNLSSTLGGTGFCLSTSVLKMIPFEAKSLTEDLEYTVRLVLAGYRVHFAYGARVYDEKPLHYGASVQQRLRWMQGHWTTAFRYVKPLLKRVFVSGASPGAGRMRALDIAIYTLQPVFVVLIGLNAIVSVLSFFLGQSWYFAWLTSVVPSPVWLVLTVIGIGFPLMAFVLERAGWKSFLYYPLYLVFNLTWIPIVIEAIHQRRNTEWVHTRHHRAIEIAELQRKI